MEVPEFLTSEETLSDFLHAFETGVWPAAKFNHAAHVAVAGCYLLQSPADAFDRIRTAIRSYNEAQGGKNTEDSGYHETLTRFWMLVVDAHLPRGVTRLEAIRQIVATLGPRRDLFREHYSFDVLHSKEARARWIPPDHELPVLPATSR